MIVRTLGFTLTLLLIMSAFGCTGGEKTSAQTSTISNEETAPSAPIDPAQKLESISPAIPVYAGASYDGNLTRRDHAMVSNRYGNESQVYTLATRDSFPQVWHYYVTYLAQFRGFDPISPFPPSNQTQRSIEVRLNEAMQDPFIPGDTLGLNQNHVILQVVEGERGEGTIIRYIVSPPAPQPIRVARAAPNSMETAGPSNPVEGP